MEAKKCKSIKKITKFIFPKAETKPEEKKTDTPTKEPEAKKPAPPLPTQSQGSAKFR